MTTAARARAFEVVPAGVVCTLIANGHLPSLPAFLEVAPRRKQTVADVASLTWGVAWDGPSIVDGHLGAARGVIAYRDTFRHDISADAREIIHIAGNPRAVVEILYDVRDECIDKGLVLFGHIAPDNFEMAKALHKLGARKTRVLFQVG